MSVTDRDPLLEYRAEFPILDRCTYLVSNSLGAMPRAIPARLAEYAEAWGGLGVRAWASEWWDMPVRVGDAIAPLIGAGPGEIAMLPNVTIGQTAVLSSLTYEGARDGIVMTDLDFPSVRYVYDGLAARLGARIEVVPSDDGVSIDTERLLAAIDERTRLVAISHVLFRSAYIMDVAAICARAHEVGALVSVDSFHAVGVIPVDVRALGVDFLTGGVLKWLCGGPGGCFLWVAPQVSRTLTPAFTGWQAHARPFGFEPHMEPADGAWRWLNGTPVIPALYAASEGPRLVREAGIERIRAKSTRQTTHLIARAREHGWAVTAPEDGSRRGGTVAIDVPHAYGVAQALLAENIVVDYRPNAGIRVGPHFYTSDDELDRAIEGIDDILRHERFASFERTRGVVT